MEAEFEIATKEVLASATQAVAQSPLNSELEQPKAEAAGRTDIVKGLLDARSDPAGTIVGGWANVDGELFRVGIQLQILGDPLASTSKVYDAVMSTDVLPSETARLVRELRELRNKVAHGKVVPSVDAAQDYLLAVGRVVELISKHRKTLPNYRDGNR